MTLMISSECSPRLLAEKLAASVPCDTHTHTIITYYQIKEEPRKDVISTKHHPGIRFPKYVISISTWKFPLN